MSVRTIGRDSGRLSSTRDGPTAYRAGVALEDQRLGIRLDFRHKGGIEGTWIAALPGAGWCFDRGVLWNRAELRERRGNAVAREWRAAHPDGFDA